jgi:hypothetical protein
MGNLGFVFVLFRYRMWKDGAETADSWIEGNIFVSLFGILDIRSTCRSLFTGIIEAQLWPSDI